MEELNAVENYRSLMFALSEQWMRDYLTEIYTDEQIMLQSSVSYTANI